MSVTQTVEIPDDRRLVLDVPGEVPTGPVVLTFTPATKGRFRMAEDFDEGHKGQLITQKINEIYEKLDTKEFDHYLNVGLEATRNLTKNDSW